MTREELIRNLKYEMEKHKDDKLLTFDTNISAMCKDILDYLKQEEKAINKIKFEIRRKQWYLAPGEPDWIIAVIDKYTNN